jgi:hypothetical protein
VSSLYFCLFLLAFIFQRRLRNPNKTRSPNKMLNMLGSELTTDERALLEDQALTLLRTVATYSRTVSAPSECRTAQLSVETDRLWTAISMLSVCRERLEVCGSKEVDVAEALLDHALVCWAAANTAVTLPPTNMPRGRCCTLCLAYRSDVSVAPAVSPCLGIVSDSVAGSLLPLLLCPGCALMISTWDRYFVEDQQSHLLVAEATAAVHAGSSNADGRGHADDNSNSDSDTNSDSDSSGRGGVKLPQPLRLHFFLAALCFRALARPSHCPDAWRDLKLDVLTQPHCLRFAHLRQLRQQIRSACMRMPSTVRVPPTVPLFVARTSVLYKLCDRVESLSASSLSEHATAAAAKEAAVSISDSLGSVWWGSAWCPQLMHFTVVHCGRIAVLCPWVSTLHEKLRDVEGIVPWSTAELWKLLAAATDVDKEATEEH